MTYRELCVKMNQLGWGCHEILCAKLVSDPSLNRKGKGLCTVGNVKLLDTFAAFQIGRAPDYSLEAGKKSNFAFNEPVSGGGTTLKNYPAWIYAESGHFLYQTAPGVIHCGCLSDIPSSCLKP